MAAELFEYDGVLLFPELAPAQAARVEELAREAGLGVDLTLGSAEITYAGRDAGRRVVSCLCRMAPIIGQAEGEIVCRYYEEGRGRPGDAAFEFYTVRGGRLLRQRGVVVRQRVEEVKG